MVPCTLLSPNISIRTTLAQRSSWEGQNLKPLFVFFLIHEGCQWCGRGVTVPSWQLRGGSGLGDTGCPSENSQGLLTFPTVSGCLVDVCLFIFLMLLFITFVCLGVVWSCGSETTLQESVLFSSPHPCESWGLEHRLSSSEIGRPFYLLSHLISHFLEGFGGHYHRAFFYVHALWPFDFISSPA